jgi:hypothetical protein
MKLNLEKGFVRLWIICSLAWLVCMTFLFEPQNSFLGYRILHAVIKECEDDKRKSKADELADCEVFTDEYDNSVRELSNHVNNLAGFVILSLVIPMSAFILGLSFRWIVRGFRNV